MSPVCGCKRDPLRVQFQPFPSASEILELLRKKFLGSLVIDLKTQLLAIVPATEEAGAGESF